MKNGFYLSFCLFLSNLMGCGGINTAECTYVGLCRGLDAFKCADNLYYVVNDDNDIKFVGETADELRNYCCPETISCPDES